MEPKNFFNSRDKTKDGQPVRRIPRSHRSVTGYYSFRSEGAVQFESTLERDFLVVQEFSLIVADVLSQPCEIPFALPSGRQYTYTPDFLVRYRSFTDSAPQCQRKPMLVEIKPSKEWRSHWREWLPKWKAARRYAQECGWTFRILDESRVRGVALSNILFLRRYRDFVYPTVESDWIVSNLRELGAASFDYLLARHFLGYEARAQGIAHLWHLLATRRIECDISEPLSIQTELWVPSDY